MYFKILNHNKIFKAYVVTCTLRTPQCVAKPPSLPLDNKVGSLNPIFTGTDFEKINSVEQLPR